MCLLVKLLRLQASPREDCKAGARFWYASRRGCRRAHLEPIEGDWNAQTLAHSRGRADARPEEHRPVRGECRGFAPVVV